MGKGKIAIIGIGEVPTEGLYFTKAVPFSTKNVKTQIGTVKDGKYQLAVPGWQPAADAVKLQ